MSLLPPQFQTHLPNTLGQKIAAMPAPPKPPHVHQWLAVPDSKIHSRCAECGTVTLTEIVAPKAASGLSTLWAKEAVRLQQGLPPGSGKRSAEVRAGEAAMDLVSLLRTPDLAPPVNKTATEMAMKARASERRLAAWAEIKDSALLEAVRSFFDGSADRALAVKHARSVLDEMGYKRTTEIPQHRRAEFLKALTTQPQRHYTSVTAPDGKVRMVETDAEGWIKNDGAQPVADGVRVQVKYVDGKEGNLKLSAAGRDWGGGRISHWRPAA